MQSHVVILPTKYNYTRKSCDHLQIELCAALHSVGKYRPPAVFRDMYVFNPSTVTVIVTTVNIIPEYFPEFHLLKMCPGQTEKNDDVKI